MSQTYNLGKVAITPRGAYSSTAQYTPLDILSHNGSSYLVLQNCMGVTPPNATYYMVVASKGDTGSAGASPTIAAGTVTMTPAGTSASVTNVGTNVNASFNFTLPSGNMIYTGTGVTGTSTTPTVFSGSGVTNAGVGDIYFNTSTVAFYQCTLGGAASVAKWKFLTYSVTDSSITTSKIADSAVTTNKIADGAVTEAKLDSDLNASLARVDGVYEQMTVGNAEQLVSTVGVTDEAPYLFRTSGGSADIGDRETDEIVGGTVSWNQMVNPTSGDGSGTYGNVSVTKNGDGSFTFNGTANARTSYIIVRGFTLIPSHKYYVAGYVKVGSNTGYLGFAGLYIDDGNGKIWQNESYTSLNLRVDIMIGDVFSNVTMRPVVFDLTVMFGSTIADYVYTLESGTAGAGIAWLQKYNFFEKPYYAYNAGQLMSVKTSAHKTIGFNQWDEEWEVGNLNGSGQPTIDNTTIRSKNFCRCVPNTSYYVRSSKTDGGSQNRYYLKILWYDADENFISGSWENNRTVTSPTDAAYFKIHTNTSTVVYGATYLHDICINLHWDGERDGEYEPYVEYTYALDSDLELRGILELDANNNLYADGDIYPPSGEVQRRYKEEKFDGSNDESWTLNTTSEGNAIFQITISDSVSIVNDNNDLRTRCNKLTAYPAYPLTRSGRPTYACGLVSSNRLFVILPSSSVADVTALRTWLGTNNLNVVYELATPTTESADAYTNPQIVDDFGTEEYVDTRDVPIPVGHVTHYQSNLRAKVEMMPNSPNGDGLYAVRQTDGLNAYEQIAIPTGLPTAPSSDGTYNLQVSVSDGTPTYSWVLAQ